MATSTSSTAAKKILPLRRRPELSLLISRLLNLDQFQMEMLDIVDEDGSLVMLHYREGSEICDPKLLSIRGVIVDSEAGCLVVQGQKMLPHVTAHLQGDSEGNITLTDNEGTSYSFNLNDPTLTMEPFFNGVNLRCFRYKGKNYCATYHKFDPASRRSRWYDHGTPFTVMYEKAGGPPLEVLFPDPRDSPYIYRFNVFHPELNLAILLDCPEDGFVRYDGFDMVVEEPKSEESQTQPYPLWEGAIVPTSYSELGRVKSPVVMPSMNLERANFHLQYGFQKQKIVNDPRLGGGESLILAYTRMGARVPIHIKSKAFEYRESIGYDQANRYMAFVEHLGLGWIDASTPEAYDLINNGILPLSVPEDSVIDQHLVQGKLLDKAELINPAVLKSYKRPQLLRIVWYNWLISSTSFYRPMVRRFLDRYYYDCQRLADWLCYPTSRSVPYRLNISHNIEKRAIQITEICARRMGHARRDGRDKASTTSKNQRPRTLTDLELRVKIMREIVSEERPETFYRLVRLVNEHTGTNSIHISEPLAVLKQPSAFPPLSASRVGASK